MIENITNYFSNLNNTGQALFIVGILLIITFIVLLIIVFVPEKNDVKKIYGESEVIDKESAFEEKMKDIDNVSSNDINLENDKTRNLKNIVDELKLMEQKTSQSVLDNIERYEDEQEDTAIISVEELLKANKPIIMERKEDKVFESIEEKEDEKSFDLKPNNYKREVFSSIYTGDTNEKEIVEEDDNQKFLNSLKDFRNNL